VVATGAEVGDGTLGLGRRSFIAGTDFSEQDVPRLRIVIEDPSAIDGPLWVGLLANFP
jgi:hypothetical protein